MPLKGFSGGRDKTACRRHGINMLVRSFCALLYTFKWQRVLPKRKGLPHRSQGARMNRGASGVTKPPYQVCRCIESFAVVGSAGASCSHGRYEQTLRSNPKRCDPCGAAAEPSATAKSAAAPPRPPPLPIFRGTHQLLFFIFLGLLLIFQRYSVPCVALIIV